MTDKVTCPCCSQSIEWTRMSDPGKRLWAELNKPFPAAKDFSELQKQVMQLQEIVQGLISKIHPGL